MQAFHSRKRGYFKLSDGLDTTQSGFQKTWMGYSFLVHPPPLKAGERGGAPTTRGEGIRDGKERQAPQDKYRAEEESATKERGGHPPP